MHFQSDRWEDQGRTERHHFLSQRLSEWSLSFQNQGATIKIGLLLLFGLLFSKQYNKLGILRMHWCTWGHLIDNQNHYIVPMTILQGLQCTNGSIPMTISRKITSVVENLARILTRPHNICPILGDYPALRDKICNVLRKERAGGQPFSVVIIQPFIKILIQKHEPQLLEDEKFKVSTKWTRAFIKSKLN